MAKWSFSIEGWTPIAVADATNFSNNGFCAIQGGTSTQRIDIQEVYLAGMATSSSPTPMVLGRDSTIGATTGALDTAQVESNAPLDPATAALAAPMLCFTEAGTKPQRSSNTSTGGKLILGFNAFGGIVRWMAAPGAEFRMVGNTQPLGETSLSCYTGGTPGLLASHIIYEPY